jgi:cellulose synthase/poly-beta-1,6-N-acetylglucosamine synthase-like glycosyltransferase
MIVLQVIFWLSVLLIAHSYIIYPWMLELMARNRKDNSICFEKNELPTVCLIMSVYNEEKVIREKLNSIVQSDYPRQKLTVLIGSDGSSDQTNSILTAFSKEYSFIKPFFATQRKGKPAMINYLVKLSEEEILILTDANVFFNKNTLSGLVKHFKNDSIGTVGVNVMNRVTNRDGVSIQENAFVSREIRIKYHEGLIWGTTIGEFGAVYGIRRSLYIPVPDGFSVDDFFISMNVLRQGKKAILDIHTIAYEEVSNLMTEEYRRKMRIATGNFQNLCYFSRELLQPWKGLSFAFWSHKVIRWLGPLLMITILLSNIFLLRMHPVYEVSMAFLVVAGILPIIDFFLSKIGIHIVFLRFVRHFVTMNIALLHGFINHLRGVRKHVWEPTER